MNQEIQQNTTEDKEQRMYVSWRVTLVYLLVVATAFIYWFYIRKSGSSYYSDASIDSVILHGIWLPFGFFTMGELVVLVVSIIKKPLGFVRVGLVNFIAWFPPLITTVALLLIHGGWGGNNILRDSIALVVPGLLFATFVILVNRKFQKLETELEISKP